MPAKDSEPRLGEFELIAKLFAPLSQGMPGAFGLTDDVAVYKPPVGRDIVLKTDSLIEGVHFLRDDPADTVARKALRRTLSDLAAKGAEPSAYLIALALPPWPDMAWLEAFADGLAMDQKEFEISLIGGETSATPGPVTITVTAVASVPDGALIRRNGARIGDSVFVTGTIGDAGGGLSLAAGKSIHINNFVRDFLVSRYRLPVPRLALGRALRGVASAALDVSDGLLADLGHIADVSRVHIEIEAAKLPLSAQLREFWRDGKDVLVQAASAGDDYEIAFTAPPDQYDAVLDAARRTSTQVTAIGRVVSGEGVALLDASGHEMPVSRKGYAHF